MSTKKKKFVTDQMNGQLFENKWAERFTRTHIAIPVSMFFLYAIGLIWYTKVATDLANWQVFALYFAGLFFFTFAEYNVHRYAYHLKPSTNNRKAISYKLHGVHHDYPKDKGRLALPPWMTIIVGTTLLLVFELILDKYSFSFLAGFLCGYAGYLIVHYIVHIFRPPNNVFKALWTNHAIHHYQDDTILFGVSSPLWDYVYGTLPEKKGHKKEVEVSVK